MPLLKKTVAGSQQKNDEAERRYSSPDRPSVLRGDIFTGVPAYVFQRDVSTGIPVYTPLPIPRPRWDSWCDERVLNVLREVDNYRYRESDILYAIFPRAGVEPPLSDWVLDCFRATLPQSRLLGEYLRRKGHWEILRFLQSQPVEKLCASLMRVIKPEKLHSLLISQAQTSTVPGFHHQPEPLSRCEPVTFDSRTTEDIHRALRKPITYDRHREKIDPPYTGWDVIESNFLGFISTILKRVYPNDGKSLGILNYLRQVPDPRFSEEEYLDGCVRQLPTQLLFDFLMPPLPLQERLCVIRNQRPFNDQQPSETSLEQAASLLPVDQLLRAWVQPLQATVPAQLSAPSETSLIDPDILHRYWTAIHEKRLFTKIDNVYRGIVERGDLVSTNNEKFDRECSIYCTSSAEELLGISGQAIWDALMNPYHLPNYGRLSPRIRSFFEDVLEGERHKCHDKHPAIRTALHAGPVGSASKYAKILTIITLNTFFTSFRADEKTLTFEEAFQDKVKDIPESIISDVKNLFISQCAQLMIRFPDLFDGFFGAKLIRITPHTQLPTFEEMRKNIYFSISISRHNKRYNYLRAYPNQTMSNPDAGPADACAIIPQ